MSSNSYITYDEIYRIPLSFGNIYKVDGSDKSSKYRQLVLKRYTSNENLALYMTCKPEYFILSKQTLASKYNNNFENPESI